ncbi:MAG: hypothetical protein WBA74_26815 [Cyclobacteriaceae bacterium]
MSFLRSLIIVTRLDQIDSAIFKFMKNYGHRAIRISFAIIFIWFGVLKPFGLSSAIPLVKATVAWLPFFEADIWVAIIGWWEVIIGVCFLFVPTTRIAIGLLFLQMTGTFMPLVFLPEVTFQNSVFYLPTMEGQYIIKNLMILSGALIVGSTVKVLGDKTQVQPRHLKNL